MKRNRKAEGRKQERRLNRQEAERKQVAILLTEMEEATAAVLAEHFDFDPARIDEFLDLLRQRYAAIQAAMPVFSREKRLGVLAQKFGLAAMQVLSEAYGFRPEMNDAWLKKLIEQGNKNRETSKRR